MSATIIVGDCVEQMRLLDAESVDAIVCDPPYDLTAVSRGGSSRQFVDNAYGRSRVGTDKAAGGGFMGKTWDGTGVAFDPATWAEAMRVLKPGGHLLAFGGTRTYHRMTCAIEDAGFEIRDCLSWMYASGFPKSMNVGKAIDASLGAEREVIGQRTDGRYAHGFTEQAKKALGSVVAEENESGFSGDTMGQITAPATPEAAKWEGFGSALKPAWEPVVMARKPMKGTLVSNVLEHGTGALNIDGCRLGFVSEADEAESKTKNAHGEFGTLHGGNNVYGDYGDEPRENYDPPGRWPPNVMLGHSPECVQVGHERVPAAGNFPAQRSEAQATGFGVGQPTPGGARTSGDGDGMEVVERWECVPDCPVRLLDEQSGERATSKPGAVKVKASAGVTDGPTKAFGAGGLPEGRTQVAYGDVGGASRFFFCAKASSAERNAGLADFAEVEGADDSGIDRVSRVCVTCGLTQNGSNDHSACAGEFESVAAKTRRNVHPTVKSVDVMRWLVRLVTPPGGTVLDPFMGSGTTGIACLWEGMDFIGMEQSEEYALIAQARLRWAEQYPPGTDTKAAVESGKKQAAIADTGQMGLL